jgi:hypothetical protein
MESNPCSDVKNYGLMAVSAVPGTLVQYHLSGPDQPIPDGWKLRSYSSCMFQEHEEDYDDDDPRNNPYQPDIARIVILEKL